MNELSEEYSIYYIKLNVDYLGNLNVQIKNTDINKIIFNGSAYTFEHLFEAYKVAKKEILKIPELKQLIERS